MSPAVKINQEPNLDISFQGTGFTIQRGHLEVQIEVNERLMTDYLILSKLVFDWADCYDHKVSPIDASKPAMERRTDLNTGRPVINAAYVP